MVKRIAIFTLICLVISLWPPRAMPLGSGGYGGRQIAGLAAHAAVLVVNARVRVQARAPHQPTTGVPANVALVRVVCPPVWTATHSNQTLPSHRVATHLSL
jgi:hypothetical protein